MDSAWWRMLASGLRVASRHDISSALGGAMALLDQLRHRKKGSERSIDFPKKKCLLQGNYQGYTRVQKLVIDAKVSQI